MFSVGQVAAALRGSNQPIRRSEGLSRRRAPRITRITRDADYTDNKRRPITRTTRATDHTDNTVPCAGTASVFRGQIVARESVGVFRGPGSAALRGSNQPIRRSEGLSRRSAPRITRITRDADYTDNKRRAITRTTRPRSHGQHGSGAGTASVFRGQIVARESVPVFSVGQVALHSEDQTNLSSIDEVLSHRVHAWRGSISIRLRRQRVRDLTTDWTTQATDYTDNTGHGSHGQHGSVCRNGQCFLWPDRRTRSRVTTMLAKFGSGREPFGTIDGRVDDASRQERKAIAVAVENVRADPARDRLSDAGVPEVNPSSSRLSKALHRGGRRARRMALRSPRALR